MDSPPLNNSSHVNPLWQTTQLHPYMSCSRGSLRGRSFSSFIFLRKWVIMSEIARKRWLMSSDPQRGERPGESGAGGGLYTHAQVSDFTDCNHLIILRSNVQRQETDKWFFFPTMWSHICLTVLVSPSTGQRPGDIFPRYPAHINNPSLWSKTLSSRQIPLITGVHPPQHALTLAQWDSGKMNQFHLIILKTC